MTPYKIEELNTGGAMLLWPLLPAVEEQILLWTTQGKKRFRLASNYPYELWYDNEFIGDGSLRCAPGEVLIEEWDASEAEQYVHLTEDIGSPAVASASNCLRAVTTLGRRPLPYGGPRRVAVSVRMPSGGPVRVPVGHGKWCCDPPQ